jgi:NADPH-dependent FMN reductase
MSEAVLIAAPEYAGALAGTVKNALDWIVGSGELYAKPVAVMSAGATGRPFARQSSSRRSRGRASTSSPRSASPLRARSPTRTDDSA